jgi:hypothetical protein
MTLALHSIQRCIAKQTGVVSTYWPAIDLLDRNCLLEAMSKVPEDDV